MSYSLQLLVLVAIVSAPGCTAIQLRRSTVNQARTLSDIYQQQVMDNIAKFAYDFNSLPHFSVATAGSSQITDMGSIGYTGSWAANIMSNSFNPSASRAAQLGFTMAPISDPRKLELMRCAYQVAIRPCLSVGEKIDCPDCKKLFNAYYTGDPSTDVPEPNGSGIITNKCLETSTCWFGIGCKKCVPSCCPCQLVGNYCDLYVWLLPGGQDQLTKLTIAILDYAVKDPAAPPSVHTKTILTYYDADNKPTTSSKAVAQVTEVVPADEKPVHLNRQQQFTPRVLGPSVPARAGAPSAPLPERQNSQLSPMLYLPLLRQQQETLTPFAR